MRRCVALCLALFAAPIARAQPASAEPTEEGSGAPATDPDEALPPALPPPTLTEDPSDAPEPAPDDEPHILTHIGTGDHPEWEGERGEVPRDVAFEPPASAATEGPDAPPGAQTVVPSVRPEEPPPPFVVGVGVGWARLLAMVPIDLLRLEERFEVSIPDFRMLRVGAAATQMLGDAGYVVGGGARVGMGVSVCETGGIVCEGVITVAPGFLTGLVGTRFDLNASLSFRLLIERVLWLAADGGYSLQFADSVSIVHLTLQLGLLF